MAERSKAPSAAEPQPAPHPVSESVEGAAPSPSAFLTKILALGSDAVAVAKELAKAPAKELEAALSALHSTLGNIFTNRILALINEFQSPEAAERRKADPVLQEVKKRLPDAIALAKKVIGNSGRGLTDLEKGRVDHVYLHTIDYSKVRITQGQPLSFGGTARTVGNTIHFPTEDFVHDAEGNPTQELNEDALETFDHEIGHIWQFQHAGIGYIPDSLIAQIRAQRATGGRNGAYAWRDAARAGVPFTALNPEQQAEALAEYNEAMVVMRTPADPGVRPAPFTLETIRLATPYAQFVQASGAPGRAPVKLTLPPRPHPTADAGVHAPDDSTPTPEGGTR